MTPDQRHRPLLEGARRGTVGASLDSAIGRIGGAIVQTGDLEGAAVDPGAVAVSIGEEDGSVGNDRIEIFPHGGSTGEGPHRPTAAEDPLLLRVVGDICGDRLERFGSGLYPQHGQPEQFQPGGDGVAVGVLEPGEEQTAVEIYDVCPGHDVLGNLSVAADGGNPATLDRQGSTPAACRVGGEDRSVDEGEAGRHGPAVCQGSRKSSVVRRLPPAGVELTTHNSPPITASERSERATV